MFVSFRLLVVESIQPPQHLLSPVSWSVRAAGFGNFGTPRLYKSEPRS